MDACPHPNPLPHAGEGAHGLRSKPEPKAAEQATGVVPLPAERRGKRRKPLRGMFRILGKAPQATQGGHIFTVASRRITCCTMSLCMFWYSISASCSFDSAADSL